MLTFCRFKYILTNERLAHLDRASASGAEGGGFESHISRNSYQGIKKAGNRKDVRFFVTPCRAYFSAEDDFELVLPLWIDFSKSKAFVRTGVAKR